MGKPLQPDRNRKALVVPNASQGAPIVFRTGTSSQSNDCLKGY